jgi:hypothetical protein
MKNLFLFILASFLFCSCTDNKENQNEKSWLKGNDEEKFEIISKQFRGMDVAMMEIGYRYQELYWAGKDENWEYAMYQIEKINAALGHGLERRPERKTSAEAFINHSVLQMKDVIAKKDTSMFLRGFELFRQGCNSCHVSEKVPYFMVQVPYESNSPLRRK